MKAIFKTLAFLLLGSQCVFAQQNNSIQEIEMKKNEVQIQNDLKENHKKLDDKIGHLKKDLKDFENKKKSLSKSESNLNSTKRKLAN